MKDISEDLGIEKIIIFGYGSQGRAQAKNLMDSGMDVAVCLRPDSSTIKIAAADGMRVFTNPKIAAQSADIVIILMPDLKQADFYNEYLHPHMPSGSAMVFAHGFAIHYNLIIPRKDLDVFLAAPLGHGSAVRNKYKEGNGVPFIMAIHQDATGRARARLDSCVKALSKSGPFIESTFKEEVETDIFVEQALLCGGLPELIRATFESLVSAGYNSDIAYFSCLKELKPIVNLLDKYCIANMRNHISDTARYGSRTRGPNVIDGHTKKVLNSILEDIRSNSFVKEFMDHSKKNDDELKKRDEEHFIEKIHRRYNYYK